MHFKNPFSKNLVFVPIALSFTLILQSCTRLYLGSDNQETFNESIQPDQLGDIVQLWEDGARTDDSNNQFE